jgi:glyoxylase-like metal-dependent hydrolase (beta-lactamase superfamily II)
MRILASSFLIGSAFAILQTTAPAAPESTQRVQPPVVTSFTAADQAGAVNSTIVRCGKSIVIVDAQFINPMAEALVSTLKEQGLSGNGTEVSVFITHPHPDHFFGAQKISELLPNARFFASQKTADVISQASPGMLSYFRNERGMKDILPEKITVKVEPVNDNTLPCGNTKLDVQTVKQGDTEGISTLFIKESQTLIASDFGFYGAHLWTKETDAAKRKLWISEINRIEKELKPKYIVPGHGPAGEKPTMTKPMPAAQVFGFVKDYLRKFDQTVEKVKTSKSCAKDLPAAMIKQYPKGSLKMALDATAPVQCAKPKG